MSHVRMSQAQSSKQTFGPADRAVNFHDSCGMESTMTE
jgi:hypothetical protein